MKKMGNLLDKFTENSDEYIDELSDDSVSEYYDTKSTKQDELTPQPLKWSDASTNFTTDAAPRSLTSLPQPEEVLNIEQITQIENELDEYEIVSLMYLLCEENHCNLQELTLRISDSSRKLLEDWARHAEKNNIPWTRKFIEALTIIQNFMILKRLGFNKQLAVEHYLPHQSNTSLYVAKYKKICYTICEKLNKKKTAKLIEMVNKDLQSKGFFTPTEYPYLELYFLEWEIMRYITSGNLSNIKMILKVMDEETLYNIIPESMLGGEKVKPNNAEVIKQHNDMKKDTNPSPRLGNESFQISSFSSLENLTLKSQSIPKYSDLTGLDNNITGGRPKELLFDRECLSTSIQVSHVLESSKYSIDPSNPGTVLIINQEVFYTEFDKQYQHLLPPETSYKLELRNGTQKDRDNLKNTFEKFGFNVIVEENLSHIDMISKIKNVLKNVTKDSSLFICILSHGDKGIVYGSNSCKVRVNSIQRLMCKVNKTNLQGKPKILILQSCQGQQCQKINDSSSDEEESCEDESCSFTTDNSNRQALPKTADMFTFWATVPGYAAVRHKKNGSWFIQSFCKQMEDLGNQAHFADICTNVINDVTKKKWSTPDGDVNVTTPMVVNTLRKPFFLPSIRRN